MSYKYLIILICLLIILYLYNKSQVYDKLEHFDDNIINQIASITNGEKIILNNVEITGNLDIKGKVNSDLNVDGNINITNDNKELNAKNIKVYQVNSKNGDNWIDIRGKAVFYDDAKVGDNNKTFTIPTILTRTMKSTDTDDNIIFNSHIYVDNSHAIGAQNLNTRHIHSTSGDNDWVDVWSNINLYKGMKWEGKSIWRSWNNPGDSGGYVVYS